MKHLVLTLISFLSISTALFSQKEPEPEVIKIWDEAPHNAFPDLIRFSDTFYVALREGNKHMPDKSGRIRIIRSVDGEKWETVGLLEKHGMDVREARLSITPEGKIMVLTAVGIYDEGYQKLYPMVAFSNEKGDSFTSLKNVVISRKPGLDWVWCLTWHKGIGYGVVYSTRDGKREAHLLSTVDGVQYDVVSELTVGGNPNEATLRFDHDDRLYAVIRREAGDMMGVIASSESPYTKWTYTKLPVRLGGPNFLFYGEDQMLIGTRQYGSLGTKTVVHLSDKEGNIEKTVELPSGGDTSYPGMLFHQNKLWIAYYSSHEEKTSIYLAKISEKSFK
ncbi:hypothetical protein SAMN04488057_11413 [Cyclobacterium lianum]|uniref:BNR repeat-like domain-containing protein n=1 Tax=Cyclobacterium lianum TaxID=388280 RepID=A0A1M7Q5A2_9BACT|nr:hypothetical protein [Cyclobacterium lianum]SHN25341.1 hypothetical protein SAMN04488057_11413 [Cyclobacterium lianum]